MIRWRLRLMVVSCSPRSSRMILAMLNGLLKVVGHGQRGYHHRQVRLDGLAGMVEGQPSSQVVLAHAHTRATVRGRREPTTAASIRRDGMSGGAPLEIH